MIIASVRWIGNYEQCYVYIYLSGEREENKIRNICRHKKERISILSRTCNCWKKTCILKSSFIPHIVFRRCIPALTRSIKERIIIPKNIWSHSSHTYIQCRWDGIFSMLLYYYFFFLLLFLSAGLFIVLLEDANERACTLA